MKRGLIDSTTLRREDDIKHDARQDERQEDSRQIAPTPEVESPEQKAPKGKKHLVKPRWLRITLRVLGCVLLFILLLPALLYLEPVQRLAKNIACKEVYKSTGMKIDIDYLRLSFPIDLNLEGVSVLYAGGDTMVRAKKVVADVKLLPLLKLDVRLNKLLLENGYYKMVSPDSSMIMKISAGLLTVDDRSGADIASSEINLHKAYLRDGDVSLYMNVWKKKPTPADTTSTPFLIKADDLEIENIRFAMSMLPTIDTLDLQTSTLRLRKGVINLRDNNISVDYLGVENGNVSYLAPTAEYVKNHPAPVDTVSAPSAPMKIVGDTVSLIGFKALYATKGVKPVAGFDPSYIQVSDVAIILNKFYNESSTIRLPIARLEAKERSGLCITQGQGLVSVDSIGLGIEDLSVRTLYSTIEATARVPFALMALNPDAEMDVRAQGKIGMPDIEAFMPMAKEYTKHIPGRAPLGFKVDADGSLSKLNVGTLDASLPGTVSLRANGYAENPLEIKKLKASLKFDGSLERPSIVESVLGKLNYHIPALSIEGNATADRGNYGADFRLLTSAGDITAKGKVGLNSERYFADVDLDRFNVGFVMPTLGIGHVSANLYAEGAGFNPEKRSAHTDVSVDISSIVYNKQFFKDIKADVRLNEGVFDIDASSANTALNFNIIGSGTIQPDDYTFDLRADLRNIDLQAMGMSETMNNGSGQVSITGTASPARWLYDATLKVSNLDWNLPGQYMHLPDGVTAGLLATANHTTLNITSRETDVDFNSENGLKRVVDGFTAAATTIQKQIGAKDLSMDEFQPQLPQFTLNLNSGGNGLLKEFLGPSGLSLDTLYAKISNDSLFNGSATVDGLDTGSLRLDTLNLNLSQRGKLLDYALHLGNRRGTLDEFAQVEARGYVGANRLGLYILQHNIEGENGYRLGLTAALMDSTISVHFTPLKSTIAYMPWQLNSDNYIDYVLNTGQARANLTARSSESSILVKSEPVIAGGEELRLVLENIHVQDFTRMIATAPPVTASVNADIKLLYDTRTLKGGGTLDIKDLTYDKNRLGDFDFDLKAGVDSVGSRAVINLKIDDKPALAAYGLLVSGPEGLKPERLGLRLTEFPLSVANPFLGADVMSLGGHLNGDMDMSGTFSKPVLNGAIHCDSVRVYLPMMNSTLRLEDDSISVVDNLLAFKDFRVFAENNNPLVVNGTVNAKNFSSMILDMDVAASNFQLVNNKNNKSEIYGKLFLDLTASAKGPMNLLDIKANASILGTTDIYYTLQAAATDLTATSNEDVVKFVNFNDTTQVEKDDSIVSPFNMRVTATLNIQPGMKATVNLDGPNDPDKKVLLTPSGTLNYFQNYMGDMRLNGQLNLGEGYARYSLPVMGEKDFIIPQGSYVLFNGDVMNPTLNIKAYDAMKANVTQSGNSRLVNFNVWLTVTNTLSAPNIVFNLTADGDMSVQNELESMTADQRATQAMNMLLYGQYAGPGIKANSNLSGNFLYGMLESQINNLAARYVKGVDLSFGFDQYDSTRDGNTQTTESYSYQLSKSLFNNRFKIMVGGKYATDANADENFSQNLISDISFEYIIKQTNTLDMSVRLFRHTGFESILEGEITETGVGFVMKRKLGDLRRLFRFGHKKRQQAVADTLRGEAYVKENGDTVQVERKEVEK